MTGAELQAALDFDKALAVGRYVIGHFTNSGSGYTVMGRIAKVNGGSVRVECLKDFRREGGKMVNDIGRTFSLPRFSIYSTHTVNNCVERFLTDDEIAALTEPTCA